MDRRRCRRSSSCAPPARARRIRPGIVFGADLIAGFPTETEEDFAETLDLAQRCDLTFLHVFPYSIRPGTPAARMPQLTGPVIKARAARLRALGDQLLTRFLESRIGQGEDVLIEQPGFGRTEHYAPVRLAGGLPGDLIRIVAGSPASGELTDVAA